MKRAQMSDPMSVVLPAGDPLGMEKGLIAAYQYFWSKSYFLIFEP